MKYWYFYYIKRCSWCGYEYSWRERRYEERPEDIKDRREIIPFNHNCWEE